MSDLMNAIIAAKLMGNGGSGGGGGLPEIKTEFMDILPSQTIPFVDGGGIYMGEASVTSVMTANTKVTTVWDGVEYVNTTVDFQGGVFWGNLAMLGEPDTGEPFAAACNGDQSAIGFYALTSQAASHIITVSAEAQNIPDSSMLIVDGGEWVTKAKKQILGAPLHISVTLDPSTHGVTYDGYTADEVYDMRALDNIDIVLECDDPPISLSYLIPNSIQAYGFTHSITPNTSVTLMIYCISYDMWYSWNLTSPL